MVSETVGLLICVCGGWGVGDLNNHLQPELDTSNGRIQSSNSLIRKVNMLLEEVGLIDVWREQHPNQRDYTQYSFPHGFYTIDYFLVFGKDKDKIQSCEIGTNDLSDHAPIRLLINLNLPARIYNWKLNSSLLNDSRFKEEIKEEICFHLNTNNKGEVSPPIVWDALKAVLRGKIISISSYTKKMRDKRIKYLQNKLKELEEIHKERLQRMYSMKSGKQETKSTICQRRRL